MTITEPAGLAEMKQHTRATWAAGDFPEVARRGLWEVGERIVERVGIGKDERVLDVACGTGNAALRAAQAGGQVVGLDLTPDLFEAGRRLAEAAGVSVEWSRVTQKQSPTRTSPSTWCCPPSGACSLRATKVTTAQLARVLRPGGRLGLCSSLMMLRGMLEPKGRLGGRSRAARRPLRPSRAG